MKIKKPVIYIAPDFIAHKWVISDVKNLDPVTVWLEDYQLGRGKLTVDCWGRAWTCYWGAMGEKTTLIEFIGGADDHYIAKNLFDHNTGNLTVPDYEKLGKAIGASDLDRDTVAYYAQELSNHYGPDWAMDMPTKENPDFSYLRRIVCAIKDAVDVELLNLKVRGALAAAKENGYEFKGWNATDVAADLLRYDSELESYDIDVLTNAVSTAWGIASPQPTS